LFDQAWLTQQLNGKEVNWLPTNLYSSFIDVDFQATWKERPFVHFNGDHKHCHRLDMIRFWLAGRFDLFSDPPEGYWRPNRSRD